MIVTRKYDLQIDSAYKIFNLLYSTVLTNVMFKSVHLLAVFTNTLNLGRVANTGHHN